MADRDDSAGFLWAVIAAVLFGVPTLILSTVTAGWARATDWMLDHRVLVPAAADPVLTLPATDGAGVDWSRIGIAAGALLLVAVLVRLALRLVLGAASGRIAVDRDDRR